MLGLHPLSSAPLSSLLEGLLEEEVMPVTARWIGNAADVAQVVWIEITNPSEGDLFRITINNKYVEAEATSNDVPEIVNALVAEFNASEIAEFEEITASFLIQDDGTITLQLIADEAGKPFTASVSSTNATGFGIQVLETTQGSAGQNEKQSIAFAGTPTGGTFTLTFAGQTTAAVAYNADAATLQTALEALSNIASGDVEVTGSAGAWVVEFKGAYAGTNVSAMTGSGASLTGGHSITHATTTQGVGGTNEVQTITQPISDSGGFDVRTPASAVPYYQSSAMPTGCSAATMLSFLAGGFTNPPMSISASDFEVTRATVGSNYVYTITFKGNLGGTDIEEMETDVASGTVNNTHATVTDGSGTGENEVQTIELTSAPTGGTWTITFEGQTTAALDFDATDAEVDTALEALSNIAASDITVSRSGSGTAASPYVYTVTFGGTLAQTDVAQMTSDTTSLTGGGVSITTTQTAITATDEVQTISIVGTPSGGTFTLSFDGQTTGNLDYDSTASEVETALDGLSSIDNVAVTGSAGGPWTVTFGGAEADTDVEMITGDGANLTGPGSQTITATTVTASTGKHYWSNADNWDTDAVPVTGDTVYIANSDVAILYGLDQNAVTLAALYIEQSFDAEIGLPDYTDTEYYEYRDKELKIGATILRIGDGDGPGPTLVRINTGTAQVAGVVVNSGTSEDEALPAFQWRGVHAGSTWTILGGEFGAGVYSGQVFTFLTIQIGLPNADDPEGGLTCKLGRGGTITTVNQFGGVLECWSSVGGNLLLRNGLCTLWDSAGITGNLEVHGGTFYWNAASTIGGTVDVGPGGTLDASKTPQAKTITGVCKLHPGYTLRDPHRSITFTAHINTINCGVGLTDGTLDLGRDLEIRRAAI